MKVAQTVTESFAIVKVGRLRRTIWESVKGCRYMNLSRFGQIGQFVFLRFGGILKCGDWKLGSGQGGLPYTCRMVLS